MLVDINWQAPISDRLPQVSSLPMLEQRIQQHFIDSADLKYQSAEALSKPIAAAVQAILASVTSGGKVLACGNGGSAADAQHFAAEFTGKLCLDRDPLPAVALTVDTSALTAIANDWSYDEVFARQVRAHGKPGDVFVGICDPKLVNNLAAQLKAATSPSASEGGSVFRCG